MSVLDEVLPEYAHRTRYERVVHASPEATWAALRGLTDRELPLTRLLVAARGLSPAAAGQPWRIRSGETVRVADAGAAERTSRPRGPSAGTGRSCGSAAT